MALTYIQKTVHPAPITLHESNGVAYFTFPLLEQTRMVRHAFSTRLGGASKGYFSTMNFSLTRGDNRDDVLENYRKMARILGTDVSKMVLSHQTHTTNIRLVTEADAGKGIWRERDYENIDGLITNVPGLTLVTFFADCVPLYFVDPVHRAIGTVAFRLEGNRSPDGTENDRGDGRGVRHEAGGSARLHRTEHLPGLL